MLTYTRIISLIVANIDSFTTCFIYRKSLKQHCKIDRTECVELLSLMIFIDLLLYSSCKAKTEHD